MDRSEVARVWEGNAETWTHCARAGYDVYRDRQNTPWFLQALPEIDGLSGLDIGCGEGANTRALAQRGAQMHAVDIAPTFVKAAQEVEDASPLGIHFQWGDGMALPFDNCTFDFATAFMSLMDMPEPGRALQEASRVLRPGGFLQFSILHPCFVPPYRKVLRDEAGRPYAVEVAEYFENIDGRIETWIFSSIQEAEREGLKPFIVPRFHRTLSQWVEMICRAGLMIEQFVEPSIAREAAEAEPVLADTCVAPLALIVRVRKHAPSGSPA